MSRYRLSLSAKADLDGIWLYTATRAGVETANRVIDAITNRFPLVARMPEAGRASLDLDTETRVFPAGCYSIYYRESAKGEVLISRVIHGVRDQHKAWAETQT